MRIGVLALQGDFAEHVTMLHRLDVSPVEVRLPHQLDGLDGLIMPGGESTTFAKLAVRFGLMEPLREFVRRGKPTWGTCAGLIFLAKDIGRDQPTLGMMDISVKRNAFGRQVDSFTTRLTIKGLEDPFPAIFIRAPMIESVGEGVDVLARVRNPGESDVIVAAQQANMLVTAFHPELTRDPRMHALFLSMVGVQHPTTTAQ